MAKPKLVKEHECDESCNHEEKKSESVKPFKTEEGSDDSNSSTEGNVKPSSPLDEEDAPNKSIDAEYDEAVKAINARFEAIEQGQTALADTMKELLGIVKANYESKPASPGRDSDYPPPGETPPAHTSDGLQAPRLEQSTNPNSKPFGKTAGARVALGGAADGSKETPMGEATSVKDIMMSIMKGETTALRADRARRGFK